MKKLIAGVVAAVVLLSLPFILWLIQQQNPLDVAIIDKTVPSESYREHKGLTWILNHSRYVTGRQTNYEKDAGYYGFMPNEAEESYLYMKSAGTPVTNRSGLAQFTQKKDPLQVFSLLHFSECFLQNIIRFFESFFR